MARDCGQVAAVWRTTHRSLLSGNRTQFDAAIGETNEGRREHVGARAELKTASDELMQLVELLDAQPISVRGEFRADGGVAYRSAGDDGAATGGEGEAAGGPAGRGKAGGVGSRSRPYQGRRRSSLPALGFVGTASALHGQPSITHDHLAIRLDGRPRQNDVPAPARGLVVTAQILVGSEVHGDCTR